jgi:hypothetical protein
VAALAIGSPASAAPAAATHDCWRDVLGDWFPDGRIDKTYPLPCYTEAQKHLPPDARAYSGARDDIQRALQAAIRQQRENPHEPGSGNGSSSSGSGNNVAGPGGGNSTGSGGAGGGHKSVVTRLFDRIGPANAESIPLPLLVLGGIAILLLLTAGVSFAMRRLQGRRLPPPEPGSEQL